jgi:magnesium transporter
VNALHVRALVRADEVLLFHPARRPADPNSPDADVDELAHVLFLQHLQANLQRTARDGTGMPFEFRALESALLSVLAALEADAVVFRDAVRALLEGLAADVEEEEYRLLLEYSRRLSGFRSRVKLVSSIFSRVPFVHDSYSTGPASYRRCP